MYQNPKSATTAGILGIFLGGFGAHNWYLGEKTKGIIHVCLMSGGILLEILAGILLPNVLSYSALLSMAWLFAVLTPIAGLCMAASCIWGLVEGIQILVGGDAGLAAKGYPVANPVPPAQPYNNMGQPGYGQPMGQPMQGYAQPMPGQPMQGYAQPMPGQPMPNQPMNQPMGQPMPGYGQPMNYGQPMAQPMEQPISTQPMPGQDMSQPATPNPFMNQNSPASNAGETGAESNGQ